MWFQAPLVVLQVTPPGAVGKEPSLVVLCQIVISQPAPPPYLVLCVSHGTQHLYAHYVSGLLCLLPVSFLYSISNMRVLILPALFSILSGV